LLRQITTDIYRNRVAAIFKQRAQNGPAGFQRNLPLGREASHQYGNPVVFQFIAIRHNSHLKLVIFQSSLISQELQQFLAYLPDITGAERDDNITSLQYGQQMLYRRFGITGKAT